MKVSKGAVDKAVSDNDKNKEKDSKYKVRNPYISKNRSVSKCKLSATSSPATASKRTCKIENTIHSSSKSNISASSEKKKDSKSVGVALVTPASSVDDACMNSSAESDLTNTSGKVMYLTTSSFCIY